MLRARRLGPARALRTRRAYRVLFFGTDETAAECVAALASCGAVSRLEVVTPPDKKTGRGGDPRKKRQPAPLPAKHEALRLGLPVFHPDAGDAGPAAALHAAVDAASPGADVGVVVSFGYYLPASLVRRFPMGMINLHPSLLPRFRGAAPIQHTLLRGDAECGASVIRVAPRMDAGDVLLRRAEPVPEGATYGSLRRRLAGLGAGMLAETLARWPELDAAAVPQEQDTAEPAAPKLGPADALARWDEEDAAALARRWRALSGFLRAPLYAFAEGGAAERVALLGLPHGGAGSTTPPASVTAALEGCGWRPGTAVLDDSSPSSSSSLLWVACAGGAALAFDRVQLAGRSAQDARGFAASLLKARRERPRGPGAPPFVVDLSWRPRE